MPQITDAFVNAIHLLEKSGEVEVISDLFSEDAVLSNPLVKKSGGSGSAAKGFWSSYRSAFQEVSSEFLNILDADDVSMLEWRSDAVIEGRRVCYGGVSVLETSGNKITSFRTYFDPRQLTARIGSDSDGAQETESETTEPLIDAQQEAGAAQSEGGYR